MSDIFISYASEDRARAEVLASALERQGWSVWWDREIPPGKPFPEVIKEAIDEAKCIIVLWSKTSVKSDWVQNEAAEGARRKILVPVLIDDVEIPFEFRRLQTASLVDWNGRTPHKEFDRLLEAIRAIVGQSSLPKQSESTTNKLEPENAIHTQRKDTPKSDQAKTIDRDGKEAKMRGKYVKNFAAILILTALAVGGFLVIHNLRQVRQLRTEVQSYRYYGYETYRSNFNTARTASEEILITMKVRANQVAEHPDNPDGPNVRRQKLEERIAALDARLRAWELIAQYNDVLVSLASGTDPAAIENDLTSLANNLSTFGISSLTKLVEGASPVFGVISEAAAMIDDFIKKEKFKEAVTAAQKPILGIIDILREDSDDIIVIEEQLIMLKQDNEYMELARFVRRLRSMVNAYAQSEELDKLISQYNESIEQLKEDDRDIINELKISHRPFDNLADANAIDFETMKILVDQIDERISSYNALSDQVEALNALMKEYNELITATQNSFISFNTAARNAFLSDVLNLRKALIKYRETK